MEALIIAFGMAIIAEWLNKEVKRFIEKMIDKKDKEHSKSKKSKNEK